jgi:NADH-quinone oxidoreductase subunit L
MSISLVLAIIAFVHVLLSRQSGVSREFVNFGWFQFGHEWVKLGWVLDPLTAVMSVMVTFVGLLIFIYSVGYMAEDENFTRFFGFLALFAGAMLGALISNSLLMLFMCWEVVGLTSYLLIGFWYQRPSAAAAAKKAFLVTRIGDLGFFLGMVWLYAQTGTLLFFDGGRGCMESTAVAGLGMHATSTGMAVSTAIALLIFCGAAGKSGQFPLHVWLPDAMEGPTPVSALIHAATMVAAGVFLVARVYPLISVHTTIGPLLSDGMWNTTTTLQVVTWVGAITALFGALVAVAQWDIKRILAYSTVSQLGYMMIGLGTGGVAVGVFHLITHAFFKALLFLGAGSVIHGCAGEQDIRNMGGLGRLMPLTFATYTLGMLALCGVVPFAGFWSKDEILHSALKWSSSRLPFYMATVAALLTAFYMTRQMFYVFAGSRRTTQELTPTNLSHHGSLHGDAHESPKVMTVPLLILAFFAGFLGLIGTAAWPWFQGFLDGTPVDFRWNALLEAMPLMLTSTTVVIFGLGLGWFYYGRHRITSRDGDDPLQVKQRSIFTLLHAAFYFNELYAMTLIPLISVMGRVSIWLDERLWGGGVHAVSQFILAISSTDDAFDTRVVNGVFDSACEGVADGSKGISLLQAGRTQGYLRILGFALLLILILMMWGGKA